MHPIDRLQELNTAIKQLRQERRAICDRVIRGEIESTGNHAQARIIRAIRVQPIRTAPNA